MIMSEMEISKACIDFAYSFKQLPEPKIPRIQGRRNSV